MIDHEHVLERNPSATELAASTLKYAKANERYFVELRESIPTLIKHGPRKNTEDTRGGQDTGDLFWLWRSPGKAIGDCQDFDPEQRKRDAEVSKAEIEFYLVQKVEDQFHKDFDGLDLT